MRDSRRNLTVALLCLVATAALLSACATRPLVLTPRHKPLDYIPEVKFETIHIQSFADETSPERRGFMKPPAKRYAEPPISTYNDALLVFLRHSAGFEHVDRDQPSTKQGYVLKGELLKLETKESWFKFGLAPSTMRVNGICVTHFTLEDGKTGEVLAEGTVETTGLGGVRVSGGGTYQTTTYNASTGQTSYGTGGGGASYDSTGGYEGSLSDAIANNVLEVSDRIVTALRERAERERLAESTPNQTESDPEATTEMKSPAAVSSPPPQEAP